MVKASEYYAGNYIKAAELPDGQRLAAVITGATVEPLGQDQTPKVILAVRNAPPDNRPWGRGIPLNRTNQLILSAAFGDETDDWAGKTVEIWKGTAQFNGQVVPSLKIDVPPPPRVAAVPVPGAHPTHSPAPGGTPAPSGAVIPLPAPAGHGGNSQTVTMAGGATLPVPNAAPGKPGGGPVFGGAGSDLDDEIPF
jgi:hypothetical protein